MLKPTNLIHLAQAQQTLYEGGGGGVLTDVDHIMAWPRGANIMSKCDRFSSLDYNSINDLRSCILSYNSFHLHFIFREQ